MAEKSKPAIKPVKVEKIEIPLYRLGDGRVAFSDTFGGPRKVRKFSNEDKARAEARKLAMQVLRGEALRTEMERGDIESYQRALELLQESRVPLTVAIGEWVEAFKLCNGRPLLDVVRAGADQLDRPQKTVSEVTLALLAEKRMQGLSSIYLDELSEDFQAFGKTFGERPIASITRDHVLTWLSTRTKKGKVDQLIGTRRRNNLRANLVTLFLYAQEAKLLPPGKVAPQEIKKAKEKRGAVSVYTSAEMLWWLSQVREEFYPWLVIGGFSGIRSEEICPPPESHKDRLRWEDFNWKKGHIVVRAEVSKVNERRIVPLFENAASLLEKWQGATGPVIPKGLRTDRESARMTRVSLRLTAKAEANPTKSHHPCPGLTWRHNALRHSYCSYRMAVIKNAPQVAHEAGNSVAMIKRHYHEAQEEDVANRWFAIRNGDAANIIQMDFKIA